MIYLELLCYIFDYFLFSINMFYNKLTQYIILMLPCSKREQRGSKN